MKNKFKNRETIGDLNDGKGEFVEEQLLDVYRGDIHKILSNVHRDLESLGCKDLPKVEEQFQLIEGRVEFFIEQIKFLQNKLSSVVINL